MAIFEVRVQLRGQITALRRRVLNDTAVMHQIMGQWTKMYAAYTQRRFSIASRGGSVPDPGSGFGQRHMRGRPSRTMGPWAKLSPRTLAARRPGRKRKQNPGEPPPIPKPAAILVDTGLLRRNLHPSIAKLQRTRQAGPYRFEAIVQFGSDAVYMKKATYYERRRDARGRIRSIKRTVQVPSGVTVRNVMAGHQMGNPRTRLPQRKILSDPDDRTIDQMVRAAKRLIQEALR